MTIARLSLLTVIFLLAASIAYADSCQSLLCMAGKLQGQSGGGDCDGAGVAGGEDGGYGDEGVAGGGGDDGEESRGVGV